MIPRGTIHIPADIPSIDVRPLQFSSDYRLFTGSPYLSKATHGNIWLEHRSKQNCRYYLLLFGISVAIKLPLTLNAITIYSLTQTPGSSQDVKGLTSRQRYFGL
jgi:hypothetical protein